MAERIRAEQPALEALGVAEGERKEEVPMEEKMFEASALMRQGK